MFIVIVRSMIFALLQIVITPVFFICVLFTFPLPPVIRYQIISGWARMMVPLAEVICGIRYQVKGLENIANQQYIVLSKHQSAWETMAFQILFPPQVWVLKKELLYVPFFGWGLALTSPIAIDRKAGREALKQTLTQGRDRLAKGFWIVIFPEGTRTSPGERGKYQVGGAWLAVQTGTPILPVAHNAGLFWRKNAFLKYPGTITVSIGKPINPDGLKANDLNLKVENWIEDEMQRLDQQ